MEVVPSVQAHSVLLHPVFVLMHNRKLWSVKSVAAIQMADLTADAWTHNVVWYISQSVCLHELCTICTINICQFMYREWPTAI